MQKHPNCRSVDCHYCNCHAELLEALKAILAAEWMVTHDWGGNRPEVLAKAEAAIAKATNVTLTFPPRAVGL